MPEALDIPSRFTPPDFAPGEEQRQLDHERQLCQQDAKVRQVIYRCKDWSESDFLLLACRALEEIVHPTMADQDVFRAYCALDDAMRRAKDAMNGG